jgi:hypothetical protein
MDVRAGKIGLVAVVGEVGGVVAAGPAPVVGLSKAGRARMVAWR